MLPVSKLYVIKSSSVDSNCKDPSDLHIQGKLDIQALLNTAVPLSKDTISIDSGEDEHVIIGKKLINGLNLKFFNGQMFSYTDNGVYKPVDELTLKNYIVRHININAKQHICKEAIEFVYNWLSNSETITVNTDYINYKNGLFSIKERKLYPHAENIFTVNQLNVNYIEDFVPNSNQLVDNYITSLMSNKPERIQALLQIVGYIQTYKTDIQQAMIWYGPSASNRQINIC